MTLTFNKTHLKCFKDCFDLQNETWLGHKPRAWGSYLAKEVPEFSVEVISKLEAGRVRRTKVFELNEDPTVSDLEICGTVLAWGGMNRRHGVLAFGNWARWRPVITELRARRLSRFEAYRRFSDLRSRGYLGGMGPAYFTKLIFFCDPDHNGYILDQWTGRSANLLSCNEIVDMYSGRHRSGRRYMGVSDKNTASTYENFCKFIEALSLEVDGSTSPQEVEEAMFSRGRGQGKWRNYVISQTN